jgi:CheY-like chemotaxis protein
MPVVLIVEDSDSVAPLEIALSSLEGVRIAITWNGREALKMLEKESGDMAAVITDLNLPLMDGFELIVAIRSQKRFGNLPILVVSGDNKPENSRRALELGATAFFAKPYSPNEVRDTIEGLLYAS